MLIGLFLIGLIGRGYVVNEPGLYGVFFGVVVIPLGLFMVFASLRLLLKGPLAIRLTDRGMQVRRYSDRPIPWEMIQGIEYLEVEVEPVGAWPLPFRFKRRIIRFWLEPEFHWKIGRFDRLMTGRWSKT